MNGHIGQVVAYRRVSTVDQSTQRQDLGEVDRVFEEKVSGATRDRPALAEMLQYVREGDTLRVHSMDRLARSLIDLESLVSELTGAGVTVVFATERLTFAPGESDPYAVLQRHLFAAFAEFERAIIRSRQAEGIAKAKAAGVYKGRRRALNTEQIGLAQEKVAAGVPKAVVARELGVSRQTLYNSLAGWEHPWLDDALGPASAHHGCSGSSNRTTEMARRRVTATGFQPPS